MALWRKYMLDLQRLIVYYSLQIYYLYMYIQVLTKIIDADGIRPAVVARLAGVTRAAVSRWFAQADSEGWVNVETGTLKRLADALGVSPDLFLKKPQDLTPYATHFLWDAIYPSMVAFLRAVVERRPPALARLVQQLGFADARRIAGAAVWKKFPAYKHLLHPVRRRELELIWPLYASKR